MTLLCSASFISLSVGIAHSHTHTCVSDSLSTILATDLEREMAGAAPQVSASSFDAKRYRLAFELVVRKTSDFNIGASCKFLIKTAEQFMAAAPKLSEELKAPFLEQIDAAQYVLDCEASIDKKTLFQTEFKLRNVQLKLIDAEVMKRLGTLEDTYQQNVYRRYFMDPAPFAVELVFGTMIPKGEEEVREKIERDARRKKLAEAARKDEKALPPAAVAVAPAKPPAASAPTAAPVPETPQLKAALATLHRIMSGKTEEGKAMPTVEELAALAPFMLEPLQAGAKHPEPPLWNEFERCCIKEMNVTRKSTAKKASAAAAAAAAATPTAAAKPSNS